MNTLLESLFDKYNIGDKDRHEIAQIYMFLPKQKKQNLLTNFENLSIKIKKIKKDLEIERKILVPESISEIEKAFEIAKLQSLK